MYLFLIIIAVVSIIRIIIYNAQEKKAKAHSEYLKSLRKGLKRVKVLGTRTALETTTITSKYVENTNSTQYSLLLYIKMDIKKLLKSTKKIWLFFQII